MSCAESPRWFAAAALTALVVCSTLVRFWAALGIPSPWFTPDEQTYAAIGRSLYESGRFTILGRPTGFLSLVYPAFAGLPLSLGDAHLGYTALKLLQALVMSLTAVPVYLWGRSLTSRGWALVASALTLALPGLAFSGFVMTEVVFLPVLCLTAWAMARALVRPTLRAQALLFLALAASIGTRLQAIVLVPALALALGLKLFFDRGSPRSLLRFLPLAGALAGLAALWFAVKLASGGSALGAYAIAGRTSYGLRDAVRFSAYHAADVLIMTALLPVVAVAILVVRAAAGAERSEAVRAFLAVTTALTLAFVAQVGLFASRFLGRLGERYLLGLAPLLFLGFAVWLHRRAPRPLLATLAAFAGAVLLLVELPARQFVVPAARPDAFTVIPLLQIRERLPGVDPKLLLVLAALALLALLAFVRGRVLWLLPAVSLVLLAAASLSASRVVTQQATGFAAVMVGEDESWIDRSTREPVSFLYAGEYAWSGGAPVWANLFWNRRIARVYDLAGAHVLGPIEQRAAAVTDEGELLPTDGSDPPGGAVVASTSITLFGERVGEQAGFALWRVERPARLSTRVTGMRLVTRDIDSRAQLSAYACGPGAVLELSLVAPDERAVELRRDGATYRTLTLHAGVPWSGSIPAVGSGGVCTFDVLSSGGGVHADRLELVRPS